jgi:hypothetical protein
MPHRDESPIHWQVGEAILTTLSDGYFEIPLEHLIVNAPMEKILEIQHSASVESGPHRRECLSRAQPASWSGAHRHGRRIATHGIHG